MSTYSPKGVDASGTPEDRYRIIGRIAAGGMAEIYLARTINTAGVEREVVLKRLLPELQGDHEFVQMFHDEARIASQLAHPNIVQIFELGELDGSLFIAMELLRGVNLRDLLARLHTNHKTLPLPLAVRIACEALEALNYAHHFADARGRKLNVVHRDVSPQNILITYEGAVKLVDFGVAKAEGKLHQTRAGLVKGKFAYMSPEQITGGHVDGRSDLFALSEVFYELLLRRHPFYATTDMDVLRAILDTDPPHPSALDQGFPASLGAIFMKGLRKKPGDRYVDAAAMQEALEHFLLEQRTPATTIMLGRMIRELFADKMEAEQRAREAGDDSALIEAMTAGRVEYIKSMGKGAIPRVGTGDVDPYEDTDARPPSLKTRVPSAHRGGGRTPHNGAPLADERTPPPRGESEDRLRSEVRGLFDEPETPPAQGGQRIDSDVDAAEMPTILGNFTKSQLAEVRAAAEARKRGTVPPNSGHPGSVVVGPPPGGKKTGPVVSRSAADPAEQPLEPTPPLHSPPGAVTARSPTLRQPDPDPAPLPPRADRLGVIFFGVGLIALIGAIVYAVLLLGQPRAPTMSLVIESTPPGATIILDGMDIGAVTPQTIPSLSSDRPHRLELSLEGYEPHAEEIQPAPHLGEYVVTWRFEKKAAAAQGDPK